MESVHIRINDHQILNGVKEYSVEVAMVGKYVRTFIGSTQEELAQAMGDSFRQIFTLLGIPASLPKTDPTPAPIIPPDTPETMAVPLTKGPAIFYDEHGNKQPVSPFAAHANTRFEAQVIRNGKVVED
jgi:hypothetical protein